MFKRTVFILTSGILLTAATMKDSENTTSYLDDKKVVQVGIIVKDIEQSVKHYAQLLDMEVPSIMIAESFSGKPTQFKGESNESRAKLAFFNLENIVIELIQPLEGPSTWHEFLDEHGEGVHHLAFDVKGMNNHVAKFDENNIKVVQSGGWDGGEYAYIDSRRELGVILELLEHYER